jgi:hypothetical protein
VRWLRRYAAGCAALAQRAVELTVRPDGLGRAGEAGGRAGPAAFAVADGAALAWAAADWAPPDPVLPDPVLPDPVVTGWAGGPALLRCVSARELDAAVAGGRVGPGSVAGLNVATESIAPATRQTATMLATSGMIVPCPPKGPVSLRSRPRRRWARSSR